MTLINRNIDILSPNTNHWIGEPKEEEIQFNFIENDEEGNKLFIFDDKVVSIKNEFDKTNLPNEFKKELIFAVGISSIEEIQKLIQTMSKESFLIIIEPNFSMFNYALSEIDLSIFNSYNVILFADDLKNLPFFLEKIFSTFLIYFLKNIKFYFTYFYRTYNLELCIAIVRNVKEIAKYKAMLYGNSVEDSLTGFKHNMRNIKHLVRSKDVSLLKNLFENIPAIVVAAGPSLNKNIEQLKKMKNKAVIIAVDTIANRLCNEGIIPDFICSIEREKETYTYFYENKDYPNETTIVAPLVLYPEIFDEFKGDIVIPMRENVAEYFWMQETFGFSGDNSISIGLSCAHVAFGFAEHIGASPIVLVGQDLAFGSSSEQSHAGGTIYDNKEFTNEVFSSIEKTLAEGYYGDYVSTTNIWINFRKWFENEIFTKDLFVINATEGGAKIANTVQLELQEVLDKYCSQDIVPAKDMLMNVASYPIEEKQMKIIIDEQKKIFIKMKVDFEKQLRNITKLKITNHSSEKELFDILGKLQKTDLFFKLVTENWLLRHNIQPVLTTAIWNLYDIEQILSSENLNRNKEIQLEFLKVSIVILTEIISILQESFNEFK